MVYHFFSGKYLHLSPQLMDSILLNANRTNKKGKSDVYIIIENTGQKIFGDKDCVTVYTEIAQKHHFTNLEFINSRWLLLLRIFMIGKNDRIVFHSSLGPKIVTIVNILIYLLGLKKKAASICYVCWGGDFGYCNKLNKCDTYIEKFITFVYEKVWPWYGYIIALTVADKKILLEIYKSNNIVNLPYIAKRIDYFPMKKKAFPIRIMVSHSGWEHNRHIESFNLLKRFKDEDILIICPLCYGDPIYINDVIYTGKRIFGEKFYYFTDLMSPEEYFHFILQNHIYISGAENQTGLGALLGNMRGNAKLYLRGNLYISFKEEGFDIFDYNEIENMTFEEFVKPNSDIIFRRNIEVYNKKRIDECIEGWKDVYNIENVKANFKS